LLAVCRREHFTDRPEKRESLRRARGFAGDVCVRPFSQDRTFSPRACFLRELAHERGNRVAIARRARELFLEIEIGGRVAEGAEMFARFIAPIARRIELEIALPRQSRGVAHS
jgi:hypothetical protein